MDAIPIIYVLFIARWIHFAALFVLFGSSFFWFYMGREQSSAGYGGLPRTRRATIILMRVAAPIAAISGILWLAGILANMTGGFDNVADPATLRLFFFQTAFGPVAISRLALLATAIAVILLPMKDRTRLSTLAAVGALLLINQAWLGHAAEGGAGLYGALMIAAYGVHLLAAGAWVGGLPPLLFALVEERNFNPNEARLWTLDTLSRYSVMGMVAVTLIIISGIANAGFRVAGSFGRLFDTFYGEVLFAKIGVVMAMLALAYVNRFVLMPELRTASFNGLTQARTLRRSATFELVLGILVLAVAAVLGIAPPPQ
ncbi:copper homeostasis membrane protein CopD [Methyloferula stellata]|uniref:copper homeostasis membrane protein CopD n=1 Tax=Methyloferula stellata TaxID=876270 RepID=UPI0003799F47|nr:copper homeostasis membrane protein CopD [Methyloferula stellata]